MRDGFLFFPAFGKEDGGMEVGAYRARRQFRPRLWFAGSKRFAARGIDGHHQAAAAPRPSTRLQLWNILPRIESYSAFAQSIELAETPGRIRMVLSRASPVSIRANVLNIHLCMTSARTGVTALGLELARDIMHASGRSDIVTGLKTKTHMGHPDWEAMLGEIKRIHEGQKVDVFFCGPRGLANKLRPLCERMGMSFREERF